MNVWGNRICICALCAAAALDGISSSGASESPAGVPAVWQHHRMKFNYFGVAVLYSCDALESQVQRILMYFGARNDLQVTAGGCPRGPEDPSHHAWVDADFFAPAPASDADETGAVLARWTPVKLTPGHPNFMDKGDCDLVQGMKDIVTMNFTVRGLDYATACFPGELTNDGFAVTGEALIVMGPASRHRS